MKIKKIFQNIFKKTFQFLFKLLYGKIIINQIQQKINYKQEKIEKSARNIPNVKITDVNHFSSYDIIKFKKVVFTESSVKELEKRYS